MVTATSLTPHPVVVQFIAPAQRAHDRRSVAITVLLPIAFAIIFFMYNDTEHVDSSEDTEQ